MKKIIDLLKKEHYLQFIIYIFIFGLIAVGLFFLDKSIQNSNFVEVLKFSQDFHSDFLMMMTAAIITMVTITFSIIMVVLTLYSGQFSPRTLNDFLQRKVPLNILGYFIGTTVFTLISLVITEKYPNLVFASSTLFSLINFVITIVLFAYYIHYVSKAIQVNNYIDNLAKKAIDDLDTYQKSVIDNPTIKLEKEDSEEETDYNNEFKTSKSGYFTDVSTKKLLEYLKENDVKLTLVVPINEHVYEDDVLFKYHAKKKSFSFDESIIDECFTISDEPSSFGEYRDKTLKLTEIAVRALSPGTNDPATAISCINQLGYVFMKLSDNHYSLHYQDDENVDRITVKTLNYNDLLYEHFYQIYLYGKSDLTILNSMLKAFLRISKESNHEMKASLWDFAEYIVKDLKIKEMHRFDLKELLNSLKTLAISCNKKDKYKLLISNKE
jgi:uncharacterized membrane protein